MNNPSRKVPNDHQMRKSAKKGMEMPKICCMTLPQKVEELYRGTTPERRKEIIDSLYHDINCHNLEVYLLDISKCCDHRNGELEDAYAVIKKRLQSIIKNMKPAYNPNDKRLLDLLETKLQSDRDLLKEIEAIKKARPYLVPKHA